MGNRFPRRLGAVMLISLSLALQVSAQTETRSTVEILKGDCSTLLGDAASIISSPLRFSVCDWGVAAGSVGMIAGLHGIDGSVRSSVIAAHGTSQSDILKGAKLYGEGLYAVGGSVIVYTAGFVTRDRPTRETGLMLMEALAFAGATTTIAKSVLGRSRPYTGDDPHTYSLFSANNDKESMPSGHATVAFAVSSVLASRIGNRYATIGLFSLAGLTACSRVYDDQHWVSDVVAGAAIGATMGLAVVNLHKNRSDSTISSSLSFSPTLNGLEISYRF